MVGKVPDIANLDEWDIDCPSNCGNNVNGSFEFLGIRYAYCSKCKSWYNLDTGKSYQKLFMPYKISTDSNKSDEVHKQIYFELGFKDIIHEGIFYCIDQKHKSSFDGSGLFYCSLRDVEWRDGDPEPCETCKYIPDDI